ncbi:MAG: hypothetical protein R6U89_02795 [Dehalococcoidia bacterium]
MKGLGSARSKRILICVGLNLLLELWVHGITGFLNPVLAVSLLLIYLSYFMILDDLVTRLRLRDYQVLILGFTYGMLHETFNTGSVFNEAFLMGVNPVNIFMANVLWWGVLQSVFAYYFASTVVRSGEGNAIKMGARGWIFAVGVNAFFFAVLALEGNYPEGTRSGYVISVVLIACAVLAFIISVVGLKSGNVTRVERVRFVDTVIRAQMVVCVLLGVLHSFVLGEIALYLFVAWSVFTGAVYTVFAVKGHRFIGCVVSPCSNFQSMTHAG